ncbi:autotransporter outer membrane beta-barrel domain-containing protein [Cupriavidus sp. UGS-1]|uniref:autotransporter outer membrane beta-barrel domain-containing protein n=1 Tax=Cupriavidus sp. UGS-1 TaxID=2899826 RepID=UPI001E5BFBDA|nr:autotransporter outer membrane beta-barrel domain-containing protein [Cupriavidus sp. UGS-1]MCD9121135.1 autotransporter outer membrane beta-barrel domain-containing protein [Cupriavidus sp. UGS-1]
MNHVFRIIWSQALGSWVVASEVATPRGKSGGERRRCRTRLARVGAGALTIWGLASPASAQVWTGATSNDWMTGSNWSTNAVPSGNVTINQQTNSVVLGASGPAAATMGTLQMGTAAGTSGLTIQNGSTLSSSATTGGHSLGLVAGSNATMTVTGAGSEWSTAIVTIIGAGTNSTGTLNIADGATASLAGLNFGQSGVAGTAVLNVTGGSVLSSNNATMYAIGTGSSTANISGTGSRWNVGGNLIAGRSQGGGGVGSGTLNVHSGGVVTATGNISIGGNNLSGTGPGSATVSGTGSQLNAGGTLSIGSYGRGALTIADDAVASAGTVTMTSMAASQGTLSISNGGTLATGALTAGPGAVQADFDRATLRATGNSGAFVSGFTGTELNVAAGGLTLDTGGFNVTVASPFSGAGSLTKTGAGTAVLTDNNTYTGGTTISAGTLQLGNGGTSGGIAGDVTNNGTLAFNRSDTAIHGGTISGSGAVSQIGTGTTILTGNHTYTGGTTISAGTLQMGNGGTSGSINGDVTNNGTLAFDRADTYTFGGQISGNGAVSQTGTGTTVLTGNNTYTGGTSISGGTLQIASDINLGNAAGSLSLDGGTLRNTTTLTSARTVTLNAGGGTFQTTGDLTLTGVIAGSGSLGKTDVGTLVLTGDSTYAAGTTVSAGTLQLGNGGTSGSITGNVANNGALVFNRSDSVTFGGAISGSGSVTQAGAGTTVLTGANSYSGTTTVQAGTLLVDGNQAGATGATTVQGGATLGGTGTLGGSVTLANGATLSPGATGAVGALTVNGNLSLASGAALDYQFGQANTPGGPLNDLTVVNGNLALGGVLNVSVSPGGSFDPGVYRIFNYAGTLTNSGLSIGAGPAGTYYVQTSVANQVNLVNNTGITLNFWNGAGSPNSGAIHGGDGTWQGMAGKDNWADSTGNSSGPYAGGAFAVFAAAPGTVTVDNSLGHVTTSGMQFASSGYTITGDALTLSGGTNVIRVGDGTAAGQGMTATIRTELGGAGTLQKTDLGTLVLDGNNTYGGGTHIQAGTLSISREANLGAAGSGLSIGDGTLRTTATMTSDRSVALTGAGSVLTDAGTTLTLTGGMAGAGGLTKAGAGTLLLRGADTHTGATQISGGTLAAGAAQVLSAASAYTVGSGATLAMNGFQQTVGALTNAGTVSLDGNGSALTVAGNYTGAGGTVQLRAALGGDNSVTDRLVVRGDTSGTTTLKVSNVGGAGAQTVNGIKLVDVAGQSTGNFALQGDYTMQGQQAVIGGAYAYTLQKNGISTPADGDWYLRSSLLNPTAAPASPLYQPGAPVYEAYSQVLLAMNELPTLHQRVGSRYWADGQSTAPASTHTGSDGGVGRQGAGWARVEGRHLAVGSGHSSTGTQWDLDQVKAQAGFDALLVENASGRLFAGIGTQYSRGSAGVNSFFGNGRIRVDGYGLSGTATWSGASGFYVDGQAQATWYDSDLTSGTLGRRLSSDNKGFGRAFSIESGQRLAVSDAWSVTPQAQLVYSSISFDGFTDPFGARVNRDKADSLTSRLGVALDYTTAWRDPAGHAARANVYGIANLYYDFRGGTTVNVSDALLSTRKDRLWAGLGVGGAVTWKDDRFGLYGELLVRSSLEGSGSGHDYRANVGVRVRW